MKLFLSAGEPSGDLHAANLAAALLKLDPTLELVGLGGPKMAAAGVKLRYPLTDLAIMWFGRAMLHLPTFFRIARQSEAYFRSAERPDAVVVTDYPGFHWALAKRARRQGVPVYYFVPPQLWAWAGWRVAKVRRYFRAVLTALPFEPAWYAARGVATHHVGHPYFDELAEQRIDDAFVKSVTAPGRPVVTILPGSRTQEVTANGPLLLAAAKKVAEAVPGVRLVVAAFRDKQAALVRQYAADAGVEVEVHTGRTPELIEAATACLAVSGSVGLELLTRLKPAVIAYRITPLARAVSRQFIVCKYISLVNLLADRELYPEFLTTVDDPDALAAPVIRWLRDPAARDRLVGELRALRDRVAIPGACDRAAAFVLADLGGRAP